MIANGAKYIIPGSEERVYDCVIQEIYIISSESKPLVEFCPLQRGLLCKIESLAMWQRKCIPEFVFLISECPLTKIPYPH